MNSEMPLNSKNDIDEPITPITAQSRGSINAIKQLNLGGLSVPQVFGGNALTEIVNEGIKKPALKGIPKLNIGGLGLSELS